MHENGKSLLFLLLATALKGIFLLFIFSFVLTSCSGSRRKGAVSETFKPEETTRAEAFLYDVRIVEGNRIRNGKAELYAIADTAVLRIKGYLGTLGAIVIVDKERLSMFFPREHTYSQLSASGETAQDSCQSLWQLWPLLLRPTLSGEQLDSLHAWTIVNRSEIRQQLLWQVAPCSLTVTVKARQVDGFWHFDEVMASQADGYIRLTLREGRGKALVPASRFTPPDTNGWSEISAHDLSLSLD